MRQVHIDTPLDPRVRGDDGLGLWAKVRHMGLNSSPAFCQHTDIVFHLLWKLEE